MNRNCRFRLLTITALAAGVAACSDTTGGNNTTKPPASLTYLHLAPTAPLLCADSVGDWFVKNPSGQDKELALTFPESGQPSNCAGGNTEDFVRIKVDRDGLFQRPDGSAIADGDSVFISIVWVGGDSVLFHLSPTGLVFNPSKPTELKISFGESEEVSDTAVINQLSIWRQATLLDDFQKLSSTKLDAEQEFEAKLNGFSRYALAY